ncbi:MAG: hypothetical protein R6U03_02615 [Gillisia sp.]
MEKFKKILKNLVFPVTLLTIITFFSLLITILALYIAFTNDHTAAIYAAISIPITVILMFLYIIDRMLIKKVSYYKVILGEIAFGILIFLFFSYQDSYIDINFHTDQDYILVIFDSKENSLEKFNKKGLFGKELNVYDTNTLHLNRSMSWKNSMSLKRELRINEPKEWLGSFYTRGNYYFEGDSIEYIYLMKEFKEIPNTNFLRQSEVYIDSLLKQKMH